MKYLTINIEPIRIKGDVEDPDQLQADVYERLSAMIESETLSFEIDEDSEEDELDF